MKWLSRDTGLLQTNLQGLHDMLTSRRFSHEGQNVYQVAIVDNDGAATADELIELQTSADAILNAISALDGRFHDILENLFCNEPEYTAAGKIRTIVSPMTPTLLFPDRAHKLLQEVLRQADQTGGKISDNLAHEVRKHLDTRFTDDDDDDEPTAKDLIAESEWDAEEEDKDDDE